MAATEAFERGGKESVVEPEVGRKFGQMAEQRIAVCVHGTKQSVRPTEKYLFFQNQKNMIISISREIFLK